jgi:hypothetical protein
MAVAITHTAANHFGAKVVCPRTGLLLDAAMGWFNARPGAANSIAAGRRPLANMGPALLVRDGRAVAALGAPGGRRIICAVAGILDLLSAGVGAEEALATPRADASGDTALLDEALEAEAAALRAENARLRRLLELTPEQARQPAATQTGLFLDRPGPVTASSSGPDKVRFFRTLFAARKDVYAIRWENARTGRSGWSPAVEGGWRKGTNRPYLRVTDRVVEAHLTGEVHLGLYPLLVGTSAAGLRRTSTDRRRCSTRWSISRRPGQSGFRRRWRCRGRGSGLMSGSSSRARYPLRPLERSVPACCGRRSRCVGG